MLHVHDSGSHGKSLDKSLGNSAKQQALQHELCALAQRQGCRTRREPERGRVSAAPQARRERDRAEASNTNNTTVFGTGSPIVVIIPPVPDGVKEPQPSGQVLLKTLGFSSLQRLHPVSTSVSE